MRDVRARSAVLWMMGVLGAGTAQAQLPAGLPPTVPQVQLPQIQLPVQVPGNGLPQADRAVDGTLRGLAGLRAARIGQLAREHRAELDRDPAGELVLRAEVLAIDPSAAALDRALAEHFLLRRTHELPEIGLKVSVLQTPQGWSAARGLKRLRKLDPDGTYDFNHVYLDSGDSSRRPATAAADAPAPAASDGAPRRVGLIDGGVDGEHEFFRHLRLQRFGCDGRVVPTEHGTAVAALLASRQSVDEILAADVYCGMPSGGAIDAVAAALGWMAHEHVAVINISLVGPRNALLERVVHALVAGGYLIVAAVGNDGPAAPPLYPASYDGVVGVTAVDRNHHALIEACRGPQVDFAAPGADLTVPTKAPKVYATVRGTSFAAPIVAALFTANLQFPDPVRRDRELARWTAAANDLGKHGRDDIYGAGELGASEPVVLGDAINRVK